MYRKLDFDFFVGTIGKSQFTQCLDRSFNVKTSKITNSSSDSCCCVGFQSCCDAGLFGCCGKDRCPPPPKVEVCLMICSPCDGCPVPVTLCVPECCVCEEPDVTTRCALIGSGVTHVDYCCCGLVRQSVGIVVESPTLFEQEIDRTAEMLAFTNQQ